MSGEAKERTRRSTLGLTCAASLAGAPVVSVPITTANGHAVGMSVIGAPGTDRWLLAHVAAQS
jgi:amidase